MKQKMRFLILVGITIFTSLNCSSQTHLKKAVFNIHAMGMDVGTITVNQKTKGDTIIVEAISQVEVRIIFKIKVKYIQTSTYKNGVLQESLLKTYKKDAVNSVTSLTKNGNGYVLDKDGKISHINDIIKYSGSMLYFHEPNNVKDLYFEINGEKTTVKTIKAHEYSIRNPDNGNENEYNYKNGNLKNATIKHSMANVYLTLNEETAHASSSN